MRMRKHPVRSGERAKECVIVKWSTIGEVVRDEKCCVHKNWMPVREQEKGQTALSGKDCGYFGKNR